MAIKSVRPIEGTHIEVGTPIYVNSGATKIPQYKFTNKFFIECDDFDTEDVILAAADNGWPLPEVDDLHPEDAGVTFAGVSSAAFCARVTVEQQNVKAWIATCEYETWNDPVIQDPVWESDPSESTEILDQDKDGTAILSTAGLPLVPGLEIPSSELVLSCTFARDSLNPAWPSTVTDAVNDDLFATPVGSFSIGYLKCSAPKISRKQKKKGGTYYFEVRVQIKTRSKGWEPWNILNASMYVQQIVPGPSIDWVPIVDLRGVPVSAPVPISEFGVQITTGLPGAAYFIPFHAFNTIAFTTNIPPT